MDVPGGGRLTWEDVLLGFWNALKNVCFEAGNARLAKVTYLPVGASPGKPGNEVLGICMF